MYNSSLRTLDSSFLPLVNKMSQIIISKGRDYKNFSADERRVVAQATTLAGAIKSILDTPILDSKGNLTLESARIIEVTNEKLKRELQ